ncbi:hypothetical protein BDA96_01G164400 [Sorghum bicolor]|jgi:hypothetical protein|uniref:Uncharacterized protein n=2 Tax=Sorghum bicolor TaxID=4558 RepID=A0A921S0U2_SORBI|nr:uncharacterized protein LOC8062212 [Sorghum bicolor]EER91173.1 hypothetical protein SORBI_3001G156200 [Sorghum bicolor]KAG0548407.1 hypothetical protein BDA96_01G164400 [Sorghum bicolor]|eukprot:XP_002464175.1 uncharacterized protein LOC8062212 [Sorghum bicolor]
MDADETHQPLEPSSLPPPPRAAVRSRPSSWSSSGSSGGVEYTSLRDVLAETGPGSCGGGGSFGDVAGLAAIDFDASNINIRNQLLKHAASAYLQSAIVVPPRDRGCLSRLWRRLLHRGRCRFLLRPWPECCDDAGDPACLCAAFVAGSARRLVAFLSGCVARMWT